MSFNVKIYNEIDQLKNINLFLFIYAFIVMVKIIDLKLLSNLIGLFLRFGLMSQGGLIYFFLRRNLGFIRLSIN